MKARGGRRETPGKVLKDQRSPRERGRMGTSVRNTHLVRAVGDDQIQRALARGANLLARVDTVSGNERMWRPGQPGATPPPSAASPSLALNVLGLSAVSPSPPRAPPSALRRGGVPSARRARAAASTSPAPLALFLRERDWRARLRASLPLRSPPCGAPRAPRRSSSARLRVPALQGRSIRANVGVELKGVS